MQNCDMKRSQTDSDIEVVDDRNPETSSDFSYNPLSTDKNECLVSS